MDLDLRPLVSGSTNNNRVSEKNSSSSNKTNTSENDTYKQVSTDKIELTAEAMLLKETERRFQIEDSPSDSHQIETISSAIASGQYQPDYEIIAEKIMQSESLLYI